MLNPSLHWSRSLDTENGTPVRGSVLLSSLVASYTHDYPACLHRGVQIQRGRSNA